MSEPIEVEAIKVISDAMEETGIIQIGRSYKDAAETLMEELDARGYTIQPK